MRVAIYNLGCKANQYEGQVIKESFIHKGNHVVPFEEKADIYVINSCVVTAKAERESRQAVNRARRANKDAKIILTSCFAKMHPDINEENVVIYTGNRAKIAEYFHESAKLYESEKELPLDISKEKINDFSERNRAFIKIEEGCGNSCSYCIVPRVRGEKIMSKPVAAVVEEASALVRNGYREIVLTGVETANYGSDTGETLASLLREMKKIPGLNRVRISSIHPQGVTDGFIAELSYPVVPHLHIPLQSGDNGILMAMKRGYTAEDFLKIINKLKALDKDFSVSTDIMVGFPGETEKSFLNSVRTMKEARFSKVHIFRYSERPGTQAELLKDAASEEVAKDRVKRLNTEADTSRMDFKLRFMGKKVEVLVEDFKAPFLEGFTPHYLKVKFTGERIKKGEIVRVAIERTNPDFMEGRRVE